MGIAGLELNDAGVALAAADLLLAHSPGYALDNGGGLWLGEAAYERARLAPRQVNHVFWERLDVEALARPVGFARTHADLAAAHLEQIWSLRDETIDGVVVAVPGSFSRLQLGLLLGVAEQIALPVRGIVDSALAAVAGDPAGDGTVVHVEARLHGALITLVERGRSLRVVSRAPVEGFGLLGVADTLARAVAARFVRETRFDPRRSAGTEQALYSGLWGWLSHLHEASTVRVELTSADGVRHAVEIERAEIVSALAPWLAPLAAQIGNHSPMGAVVRVGHHLARIPFVLEHLSGAATAAVEPLARGAGALGAAACAAAIVRAGGPRSLVSSLGDEPAPSPAPLPGGPPRRPTHVVRSGIAHAIAAPAFALGSAPGRPGGLAISGCADPVHCVLHDRDGVTVLEPASSVTLNGRAVERSTPVAAGDRIGFPGGDAELLLIAVDDGARA